MMGVHQFLLVLHLIPASRTDDNCLYNCKDRGGCSVNIRPMLLFLGDKKRRFKKQLDNFQINQRFLGARVRNARQIGPVTWRRVECEGYFLSGVAMTDIKQLARNNPFVISPRENKKEEETDFGTKLYIKIKIDQNKRQCAACLNS